MAERVVAGGDRSSGASVAGGHSPSPVALAAGSCTPTGRWSAARRPGIRSGGRLAAKTTTCTLDTKAQLARGVEQLDHVRHAGGPVLSAPSPRHTDCPALLQPALSRALSRELELLNLLPLLSLSLSFSRFYCMRRTWTQAGFNGLRLSPILPLPLRLHLDHLDHDRVDVHRSRPSRGAGPAHLHDHDRDHDPDRDPDQHDRRRRRALLPPQSAHVQPARETEGESESEGEELLIKRRVRGCSANEREREEGETAEQGSWAEVRAWRR